MVSAATGSTAMRAAVAIALLVACAAVAGSSADSSKDQYRARERGPQLHPATPDAATELLTADNHSVTKKLHGDKTLAHQPQHPDAEILQRGKIRRQRRKRYSPWAGNVQDVPNFSRYQPQTQQISRPYIIPVWYQGANRIPVYLPPQPVYSNPGYPEHNKPGPQNAYLPPPPNTPSQNPSVVIETRFEDDPIYWGMVDAPVQRPSNERPTSRPSSSSNANANRRTTTTERPINRPTRPNTPVEREPGDGSIPSHLLADNSDSNFSPAQRPQQRPQQRPVQTTQRPQQQRPQQQWPQQRPQEQSPPIWGESSQPQQRPQQRPPQAQQRPPQAQQRPRPVASTTPAPNARESGCVWAILSCCVPDNLEVKETCFENRGCSGPFWGDSPCNSKFTDTVINSAMNYYE